MQKIQIFENLGWHLINITYTTYEFINDLGLNLSVLKTPQVFVLNPIIWKDIEINTITLPDNVFCIGDVIITNCSLQSFPNCIRSIDGVLDLSDNELNKLELTDLVVSKSLILHDNRLSEFKLRGIIKGSLDLSNNKLKVNTKLNSQVAYDIDYSFNNYC